MLLKSFRGGKAVKIPAGCEFDSSIYNIFLSANVPTMLCIMSWILHLVMVDVIMKWAGIHTAKNINIPRDGDGLEVPPVPQGAPGSS